MSKKSATKLRKTTKSKRFTDDSEPLPPDFRIYNTTDAEIFSIQCGAANVNVRVKGTLLLSDEGAPGTAQLKIYLLRTGGVVFSEDLQAPTTSNHPLYTYDVTRPVPRNSANPPINNGDVLWATLSFAWTLNVDGSRLERTAPKSVSGCI